MRFSEKVILRLVKVRTESVMTLIFYLGLRSAQEVHGPAVMRQQGHGHPFGQRHVMKMIVVEAGRWRWWNTEHSAAGRCRCNGRWECAHLTRTEDVGRWSSHSRRHQRTSTTGRWWRTIGIGCSIVFRWWRSRSFHRIKHGHLTTQCRVSRSAFVLNG